MLRNRLPAGSIYGILLICIQCTHNTDDADLLFDILMNDPAYEYLLTDSTITSVTTVPTVEIIVGDHWDYYFFQKKWGYESIYTYGWRKTFIASSLSTSSITFTDTDSGSVMTLYKNGQFYEGTRFIGCPVLFNTGSWGKAIKMDNGTYTIRINDSLCGSTNSWEICSRIVNSEYGLLYERYKPDQEDNSTLNYVFLLRKNGIDCMAAKLLDEFYKKESILRLNESAP